MMFYGVLSLLALLSYLFMLLASAAVKKDRAINSFRALMVFFIFWTGGSFFLRSIDMTNITGWFDLSVLGLFGIPFVYYMFFSRLLNCRNKLDEGILALAFILLTSINAVSHRLLPLPEMVEITQGVRQWSYQMDWPVLIPVLYFAGSMFCMIRLLIRGRAEGTVGWKEFLPLLGGMFFLSAGCLLSFSPGIVFPFDTLAGLVNIVIILLLLCRRKNIHLSTVFVKALIYLTALFSSAIVFWYLIPFLQLLSGEWEENSRRFIFLMSAVLLILVYCILGLARLMVHKVFNEKLQNELLKEFQRQSMQTLHRHEITMLFIEIIGKAIPDMDVVLYLKNDITGKFHRMIKNGTAEESGSTAEMSGTDSWNYSVLTTKIKKQLSVKEQEWLTQNRVLCITPLHFNKDLIGVILLVQRDKKKWITEADMTFLDSVSSFGVLAIRNAKYYEEACNEARMDSTTLCYNRKYFFEYMEGQYGQEEEITTAAIAYLDVDDFALYNNLYGSARGDDLLLMIGRTIQGHMTEGGAVFRYSGNVFVYYQQGFTASRMEEEVELICREIGKLDTDSVEKVISKVTVSAGIAAWPDDAAEFNQMAARAELALYGAKKEGKNRIKLYNLGKELDMKEIDNINVQIIKTEKYLQIEPMVYAMTAVINTKDHYTFKHSKKVAEYAAALGQAIGLDNAHVELIREAGLLHDIGKIGIPEDILNKKGKLTDKEKEIMDSHVVKSIEIIRYLPDMNYVIPAVTGHHERYDGKGYPRGLKEEENTIEARCLAIADSFEAMTAVRSYKKALSVEFALSELEANKGTQFSPELVGPFVELVKSGKIVVRNDEDE